MFKSRVSSRKGKYRLMPVEWYNSSFELYFGVCMFLVRFAPRSSVLHVYYTAGLRKGCGLSAEAVKAVSGHKTCFEANLFMKRHCWYMHPMSADYDPAYRAKFLSFMRFLRQYRPPALTPYERTKRWREKHGKNGNEYRIKDKNRKLPKKDKN